jgi:hypothetical protein
MDIIKTHKKGKHMNTLEKYHIHKLYRGNLQINDSAIEPNNPIFKTIHELNNRWQHQTDKQHEKTSRSQWPRSLWHELSSPAPTLGWWIQIPLRYGCLCVFCVRIYLS